MTDQELLERIHDAFLFMPALHGAVPGYRIADLRREVHECLDWFWADLTARLGRDAPALVPVRPSAPRSPSEGTTTADEHDRPLWSAMDK